MSDVNVAGFSGCKNSCGVPLGECPETVDVVGDFGPDVIGGNKEVSDSGEDADEALISSRRSKLLHDPFTFSQGQVAVFGAIVPSLMRQVPDTQSGLSSGRPIRFQLVRDHPFWADTLLFQKSGQQALCRFRIAMSLKDIAEDVAILVNGSLKPVGPTICSSQMPCSSPSMNMTSLRGRFCKCRYWAVTGVCQNYLQ
ncbi:hypothetical protein FLP30_11170 [Acetobacter vaccinii]|uniref:Uncharacterized protein n=1 Tax=Acetobacter vaccinii TaxID=2592655 RepID=A0A5C1YR44_9PROT|nr:hypothetical protein FLP30_11170 [Acetobacter vaccinii]